MSGSARPLRLQIRVATTILSLFLCASCADQDATAQSQEESESATPLDPAADGTEQLPAGRYRLAANGDESAPDAIVRLPTGFSSLGRFAVGRFACRLPA